MNNWQPTQETTGAWKLVCLFFMRRTWVRLTRIHPKYSPEYKLMLPKRIPVNTIRDTTAGIGKYEWRTYSCWQRITNGINCGLKRRSRTSNERKEMQAGIILENCIITWFYWQRFFLMTLCIFNSPDFSLQSPFIFRISSFRRHTVAYSLPPNEITRTTP